MPPHREDACISAGFLLYLLYFIYVLSLRFI